MKIILTLDVEAHEPVWGFLEAMRDEPDPLQAARDLANEDIGAFVEDCEWQLSNGE
jgi:hypothetical protein